MVSATDTPKLLDKQIDRLYGLPLDEFTSARNELAKGLRASGDRDGAEQVRTLEKPNLVAWTVNQLVRQRPRDLQALLEAADALRQAQGHALGGGGADDVRQAQEAERKALKTLADAARELLQAAGRRSPGTAERVTSTLRAAVVDPDARPLLEQGRLTHEVESTGFGGLAALAPDGSVPQRRKTDGARAAAAEAKREARERAKRLQGEVRELRRAVQAAEGRLREAEREAERARREAADAQADLERAEAELESARRDAS